MLIQKPIEKNDVVTVKLLTGEEIIGRFEGEDENGLHVSRASVVAAVYILKLVPFMVVFCAKEINLFIILKMLEGTMLLTKLQD